jgi:nitrite reductase/ring-hydroxylating ferredoxin subunit
MNQPEQEKPLTTDTATTPTINWHELGELDAFPNGSITAASLPSGTDIAIYNVDGTFYASFDSCTHGKASFCEEGELNGHVVECGWHHGTFDVTTGAALTLPCRVPLITLAVKAQDGKLYVNPKPNKRTKPVSA